jgi:hypothetical protein
MSAMFFVDPVSVLMQIVINYCVMHHIMNPNLTSVFCQLLTNAAK